VGLLDRGGAAEAGLDRTKAEAVLNSADGQEAIKEANELIRQFRVDGVPFFIVNGTLTLSGAQQPDMFRALFRETLGQT
jgi:predicted DsbA family dithiol-disulfide isomerase